MEQVCLITDNGTTYTDTTWKKKEVTIADIAGLWGTVMGEVAFYVSEGHQEVISAITTFRHGDI